MKTRKFFLFPLLKPVGTIYLKDDGWGGMGRFSTDGPPKGL